MMADRWTPIIDHDGFKITRKASPIWMKEESNMDAYDELTSLESDKTYHFFIKTRTTLGRQLSINYIYCHDRQVIKL